MIILKRKNKSVLYVIYLAAICIFSVVPTANSQDILPHTFVAGETVSASKMNDNFEAIEDVASQAISQVSTTIRTASSTKNTDSWSVSEVREVSCLPGEVFTGGTCSCVVVGSTDYDTTNMGNVVLCDMYYNSIAGFCGVSSLDTSSVSKFGPAIQVQAVCASGTTYGSTIATANASTFEIDDLNASIFEETEINMEKIEEQALQYQQVLENKQIAK